MTNEIYVLRKKIKDLFGEDKEEWVCVSYVEDHYYAAKWRHGSTKDEHHDYVKLTAHKVH